MPTTGRDSPSPRRSHLRDRAYHELKQILVHSPGPSGSLLSERALARRLGMSNTPVRSAIERLEAEGLITISPQRGITVRELTPREIADHYEIRTALESYIVQRLAADLPAAHRARLRENLARQRAAAGARDIPALVTSDADFHRLLSEFVGNQEILRTLHGLRDKIHRVIARVATGFPERMLASAAEHQGIARAVLAGEGRRAAQLMAQHLARGRDLLLPPVAPEPRGLRPA